MATVELVEQFDVNADERCLFFSEDSAAPANEYSRGLTVRVQPDEGNAWLGVFETAFFDFSIVKGAPSGSCVTVVARGAGYVVPVNSPERFWPCPFEPVTSLLVSTDRSLVVLGGFSDVAAYSNVGLVWHAARVADDNLQLVSMHDGLLEVAIEERIGEVRRVQLDVRNGALVE
jgi:hypothetical protein